MSNVNSIGDLAQHFQMRRHNTQLKAQLNRLAEELTTGRTADVAARLGGDFSPLASLDLSLANLAAYHIANAEAGLLAEVMQESLGQIQGFITELAPTLLTAAESGHFQHMQPAAEDARQKFSATISALNTQVAGRSLFAGAATNQLPLVNAEVILADLQLAIAAETTAAGVRSVVDSWFDAPAGGFETLAYQGSTVPLSRFQIGQNESAAIATQADDPAFRDTLKGFALGALVHEGALAGDLGEQATLLADAGTVLLGAEAGVLATRGAVGAVEARIEAAAVRNQTEESALTLARNALLAVDPYETATGLEAVQAQLETLYTLTARLSRLSLVDFLR